MALQGSLRDFSAMEIVQLVGSQKKSGCLVMEWNTERFADPFLVILCTRCGHSTLSYWLASERLITALAGEACKIVLRPPKTDDGDQQPQERTDRNDRNNKSGSRRR